MLGRSVARLDGEWMRKRDAIWKVPLFGRRISRSELSQPGHKGARRDEDSHACTKSPQDSFWPPRVADRPPRPREEPLPALEARFGHRPRRASDHGHCPSRARRNAHQKSRIRHQQQWRGRGRGAVHGSGQHHLLALRHRAGATYFVAVCTVDGADDTTPVACGTGTFTEQTPPCHGSGKAPPHPCRAGAASSFRRRREHVGGGPAGSGQYAAPRGGGPPCPWAGAACASRS